MGKGTTGSRLRLGEPLATQLAAFRAAFYNTPEIEVVRVALREHMDRVLATEPERRKQYDKELKHLMGAKGPKVVSLPKKRT